MPGRQVVIAVVLVMVATSLKMPRASASPVVTLSRHVHLPENPRGGYTESVEARQQHRRIRRSYIDSSCKGLYNRGVWNDLYHLCKDCQNLYRVAEVGKECRRGCFASITFAMCLKDLYKPQDKYLIMATSLRGS